VDFCDVANQITRPAKRDTSNYRLAVYSERAMFLDARLLGTDRQRESRPVAHRQGEKRPTGILPGVELADVIMVDQYQPGTSISMEMIVGQIPFSRHLLEHKLHLKETTQQTLLVIEATQNLAAIQRGDLVLVDRNQSALIEDGVYLLNLPGLMLKEISVFPNAWVLVTGSETEARAKKSAKGDQRSLKISRSELLGDGRFNTSKVVGRAVLVHRNI
jgi:hypothetical protein